MVRVTERKVAHQLELVLDEFKLMLAERDALKEENRELRQRLSVRPPHLSDGICPTHNIEAENGVCVLCPDSNPLMRHADLNKTDRTWWVYNGHPWVVARRSKPVYGNVYLPTNSNEPRMWESASPGNNLVRVLRPAVFYYETDFRPGLIESGERRPAKQGEWIEVDGLPVKTSVDTEKFPWPILVELDSDMSDHLNLSQDDVMTMVARHLRV